MDARITVAQTTGSLPNSESPKVIKLTKPQTDQAITIHLDGATKLDLSAIGNDNVTFVHAGDRLVILFDNHSTVTIDPFYDSKGLPQADILVELSADRSVSGAEFASLFPITTDQSILPAAGDGGSPASGAHFETVTINQFANSHAPLALLGPDAPTGNGGPTNPPGNVAVGTTVTGPTLGVHDVGGNEDKPIALGITDALSISDPNAVLRNLTISGVPAGVTLSAGIHNADGSWTLTPAQLAGLTLVSDGEVQHFTLTVTGAATDAAITATSTATLNVSVTPVADTPTLTLGILGAPPILFGEDGPLNKAPVPGGNPLSVNVSGVEDRPIALAIKAALGEVDADAVLSVTISGIPAGVTLSAGTHNADGSVTLTPAQLASLTLTGDGETTNFDLKVTATAVDGGDSATSASLSGTFHVVVAPVADTPTLTVTGLLAQGFTTIDGDQSFLTQALGTNSNGDIVGLTQGPGGSVGFLDHNGTITTIVGKSGAFLTEATGINKNGEIVGDVGEIVNGNVVRHGFVLDPTPGATPTLIDVAGSTNTRTFGINDNGDVVGRFIDGNGDFRGFERDHHGVITTFDAPGGFGNTFARGINNSGQIVGFFDDSSGNEHGFLRDANGNFTTIDVPGATLTDVFGIDNKGDIVGGFKDASGNTHGFVEDAKGHITIFDANGFDPAHPFTDALGINDKGQVVGLFDDAKGVEHGFTAQLVPGVSGREGQPIALNISSTLPEANRDEALTITIGGIPDGVKLDDANHDRIVITNGSATLTPSELAGLTLTGDGVTQHFDLTLTASAVDGSSVGTPVTTTLHVDVAPAAVTEDVNPIAGNLTTAGSVSFADVGLSSTHSLSFVPLDPNHAFLGTFTPTLASDGTVAWTFTVADDATDFLAQGQTLTQTYALTVDDGHGGAVTQKVVVDINGTNEAPVIVAAATTATGAVTEDTNADAANNLSTKGTVSFTDVDLTDTHSVSVVPQGSNYLGTFTPTFTTATDATGGKTGTVGWNFTVADDATDSLAQGQTLTQTYTVTVDDHHGGKATQNVVVTINGSNEAPVVTADESTGSLTEPADTPTQDNSVPGAVLTTTGSFTFTDVDLTDKHTIIDISPAGRGASPFGELKDVSISTDTVNGIGGVVSWTYTVPVAAVEQLNAGETRDESFNVTIADNHGGTTTKTVTVTTVGTNDFPVAHDDVVTSINGSPLTEDSAPISLDSTLAALVKANDILDPDHGALNSVKFGDNSTVTVAPNEFGITASDVTVSGGGRGFSAPSITLGPKFQTLTDGEFVDVILPYTLKGDQPTDVSTAHVTFHIAGINDPPVTNDVTVPADKSAAGTPIQIQLTGSDVDGTVAKFQINDLPTGGTLFTDAAETQIVHAGDLITANGNVATLFFKANAGGNSTSFHFTAIDNEGLAGTAPATATINVNHPPVAVDQTFTVTEDGSLNISAALGVLKGDSDPDVGDTFKITAINGNDGSGIGTSFGLHFGNLVLQSDGSFTYQPQTAAGSPAQSLHAGQTGVDSFTYTITDSHGASSTANVTINVTGDSDPPIAVTSGIIIASDVRTAVDWHLTVGGAPPLPLTFAVTQSFGHTDQWGPFLSFDTTTGQFRVQTVPANGATPVVSGTGSHDFINYSVTDGVPSDPVANGQLTFDRIDGSIPANIDRTSSSGDDFHFLGAAGGVDHLGSGNNHVETSGALGTTTTVFGGNGNNFMHANNTAGQSIFHGGNGNDILVGGIASDILDGGGGNNQLFVGNSSLASGHVNHATLTGGSGNNTFSLNNSDVASSSTITDYHFTPGGAQDTIDLTSLNIANLGATFNNALFGTPGSPQPLFDPIANGLNFNDFIRLVDDPNGKDVHLQVDPDGTGTGFQFHDVALLQNHRAADFTDITIAGQDHIQFHGNNVEITDFGGAGNTTLFSGYSFLAGQTVHETLTGGGGTTGHTIFSFNSTDPNTTATINNFATGGRQDVLDFSHLNLINLGAAFNQNLFGTSGFDPTINGKNVSDFVQLLNDANGHDVHVKVDADGTAATGFHDVAVLHNYQTSGNPVDILFANAHQAILHVA